MFNLNPSRPLAARPTSGAAAEPQAIRAETTCLIEIELPSASSTSRIVRRERRPSSRGRAPGAC
jgi:hypothetical protein